MSGPGITVVNLSTGEISNRPRLTQTLDVPPDFDRTACVASVDAASHAHYLSTGGRVLLNPAHPRPLSWRVLGEVFLLAGSASKGKTVSYGLCTIEELGT